MKLRVLFKKTENKKDKLFYAYDEKTKDMYIIDLNGIKVRLRDVLDELFTTLSFAFVAAILFVISFIAKLHGLLYVGIFMIGWGMATYYYGIVEKAQEYVVMKKHFELYPEVQFTVQSLEQNFDFFNDKLKRNNRMNKTTLLISSVIFLICLTFVVYYQMHYQMFDFQVILLLGFALLSSYSLIFVMVVVQTYTLPKRRKEALYCLEIEKKWRKLRRDK